MTADDSGNDLDAVGVPVTGLLAFAPALEANIIPKADLGASPLVLPAAFKRLGLIKEDGGPADTWDNDDPIKFFQKGYSLAGDGTRSVKLSLAEQSAIVQALLEGVEPDTDGVIEASSSLSDAELILLHVTRYKSGQEKRREGVAKITKVEPDQQKRGDVEGSAVTFEWQESDLFNGAPFWQWGPDTPVAA